MVGAITAALSAGSQLYKLFTGAKQQKRANQLQRQFEALQEQRPEYSTPQEVLTAASISRQNYADPNMPGQSAMYDRTALSGQNTAANAAAGGNPFAAAVAAQANMDKSNEQIGVRSAEFAERAREDYQNQLGVLAGYRDTEYQMNEFAPWKDKSQYTLNEFRDMRQAGLRNTYGALDNIGRIGISALSSMGGLRGTSTGISAEDSSAILGKYGGSQGLSPAQLDMMFRAMRNI